MGRWYTDKAPARFFPSLKKLDKRVGQCPIGQPYLDIMDKDYWRLKKREQRAKKKAIEMDVKNEEEIPEEILKKLEQIPEKEWEIACDRAERAKKYAQMFPEFVRPSERVFQDPIWQWENEVRGRYGDHVGGSLSGTRR